MHVPLNCEAVRDAMPAFFDLLREETEPAVRVVLGHFVFVYIHPWEAGFAEGLNKRVIYTCEKSYFENANTKPHFDVNHYSHVIWEQDRLSDAADELVARIRVSIPDAKLDD